MHIPQFSLKRVFRVIFLKLQILDCWPGMFRYRLLRYGGVNIGKLCHIGAYNIFDTIRPDLISIGEHATISVRCILLTHFVHQQKDGRKYSYGKVIIGNNVFIGANVVICQPVTIGDNAVIAAGSVVTKNIPSGEIWGGVPAKFLKKINEEKI